MSESRERRLNRSERKQLLRMLQDSGMNRTDARRRLYGDTWKTKHVTRRALLAAACQENARTRKEAEGASEAGPVSEEPEGEAEGRTEGQASD